MKKYIIPAVLCLLLATAPAYAQADAQKQPDAQAAQAALESTINQVLHELESPELHDPSTRANVLGRVEAIIEQLFNFEELSMRTVGPAWNSFSKDQQERFSAAFKELLRARYAGSLEGYNGGTVSYVKETTLGQNSNNLQIDTLVKLPDKSVPINYRMMFKDRWYVYDIVIEGVSLVQNYRSQFQSVLRKNDPEELIKLVRAKAAEVQNQ